MSEKDTNAIRPDALNAYNLESAHAAMHSTLNKVFPGLWCNLQYMHHDAGGYWYTFQLVNDPRVQTYCIHPEQLKKL